MKASPVKIAAAISTPPDAAAGSPEQKLRALVERIRGRRARLGGALTRAQEDALRVLLRTEHGLDAENPYPDSY